MTRVYILGLIFLLTAYLSHNECKSCESYHPFLFSNLPVILPDYFIYIIHMGTFSALAWALYSQERKYKFQVKVAAWLVTGRFIDYLLRGSEWWHFNFFGFIFSYDTFAMFSFGLLVIINYTYQSWNSG